jgi:hypothetical protein
MNANLNTPPVVTPSFLATTIRTLTDSVTRLAGRTKHVEAQTAPSAERTQHWTSMTLVPGNFMAGPFN